MHQAVQGVYGCMVIIIVLCEMCFVNGHDVSLYSMCACRHDASSFRMCVDRCASSDKGCDWLGGNCPRAL